MPDQLPLEGEALPGVEAFEETLSAGQVRVGWVTEPEEALQGPNVMCRVGCLRIENRLVRFCIQGERNFSQFSMTGGNLIDAVRASAPSEDRLKELVIAPGLGEVAPERIAIIRDGSGGEGEPAVIQVSGRLDGSRIITGYLPQLTPLPYPVVTEYWLWPERSEIEVHTWVGGADASGGPLGLNLRLSDFVIWSHDATLYYPLQKEDGLQSEHSFFGAHSEGLSYRWRSLDSPALTALALPGLPFLPINAGQARGSAGSVQLFKRVLEVGEGSISGPAHQLAATGDLSEQHRPIELALELSAIEPSDELPLDAQGEPQDAESPIHRAQLLKRLSVEVWSQASESGESLLIAQARLDSSERAEFSLRPGAYEWRVPSWSASLKLPFEVQEVSEGSQRFTLPLTRPALLSFEASVEGWPEGELVGAKLVLSPNDEPAGRETRILHCLGRCAWAVEPGAWRASVTRGWHFSAYAEELNLSAGALTALTPSLREELPFEGWSAGEFHQHSSSSLDSEVGREARVLSNIVEGVGFMVPSDHDVLTDYPSLVRELGWESYVGAPITGVEISPLSGHLGAYGLSYDVDHPTAAGGAVPTSRKEEGVWRKLWISEIVAEARARGAELIQLNHPRDSTGYFDESGYQPDQPISELESLHWTSDFDSMEVFNGAGDLCAVMRDWIGLLNQGKRVVGVGNSDSHDFGRPAGYPRNYLPTSAPRAVEITRGELVSAMLGGRVSVGGGAYLDLPEGPLFGDTVTGERLSVRLRARTPSFTRLSSIRALLNGREIWSRTLDAEDEAIVDLDEELTLELDEEGSLIFFAEGPQLTVMKPGSPTFAFTNPIYVDLDGDGQVTSAVRVPPPFATSFCAAP